MLFKIREIAVIICVIFLISCKVDPKILPISPSNELKEITPVGFPNANYTFSTNIISENKFILGRALFYETLLSNNNTISCGSCHQQYTGFANADHDLSHGVNNLRGQRNASALFNLVWHPYFMHDGGINHIEVQPLAPIANVIEMGEDINHVIEKLQASDKYKTLFKNAFGTDEVTSDRLLKAITQFQGLIYSYNSKYDYVKRKEKNISFTSQEARGYNLFLANCNACHTEPLFSDFKFRNNGLLMDPFLKDSGRYQIEKLPENTFKFKTPSLRNVALTFPYMHDGRFKSIEQCLNHYTNPIGNLVNLDPLIPQAGILLSESQKSDIISFLGTLTDTVFTKDMRFADPNFH